MKCSLKKRFLGLRYFSRSFSGKPRITLRKEFPNALSLGVEMTLSDFPFLFATHFFSQPSDKTGVMGTSSHGLSEPKID